MAKVQKRSNREQLKPKQDKPKAAATRSALGALHERPAHPTSPQEKVGRGRGGRPARLIPATVGLGGSPRGASSAGLGSSRGRGSGRRRPPPTALSRRVVLVPPIVRRAVRPVVR
jgi:hypothetical protein